MYNNLETLIEHQGWARAGKIDYLVRSNMEDGLSREEIEERAMEKHSIFRDRSFKATWNLYQKIKKDIKYAK